MHWSRFFGPPGIVEGILFNWGCWCGA